MLSFSTHSALYRPDNVVAALAYAKGLTCDPQDFNIHFYWRVPRAFARKQAVAIKSAIVTQSRATITLWSNVDLSCNEYVKPLLPFITLRHYDIKRELAETFIGEFARSSADDELCWLGGDLFRVLILYKYGGVYCDMDVILLRDLSPLVHNEFLYQWGSSGTTSGEPQLRANGAVMHLRAGSEAARAMLDVLRNTPAIPNTTCWGSAMYSSVLDRISSLRVYPCAFFDTEWCLGISLEPFKLNAPGNDSDELYEGAFAWHWHNKWDEPIEEGSKFWNVEQLVETRFRNL